MIDLLKEIKINFLDKKIRRLQRKLSKLKSK